MRTASPETTFCPRCSNKGWIFVSDGDDDGDYDVCDCPAGTRVWNQAVEEETRRRREEA